MKQTNLTLIGFPTCGKSTIGKEVAQQLGMLFLDTDRLIEERFAPLSCSEIFRMLGETEFRDCETKIIKSLKIEQESVIAIGGGGLIRDENGFLLKQHSILIYLRTPLSMLKERISSKPSLPAYLDSANPMISLESIYNTRVPLYERWADLVIDMHDLDPKQASFEIITRSFCLLNNGSLIDGYGNLFK